MKHIKNDSGIIRAMKSRDTFTEKLCSPDRRQPKP